MTDRQLTLTGEQTETTLVNVKHHGRKDVKMIGRSTKFGSPFKLKKDGGEYTREGSVQAYAEYFHSEERDDLRKAAKEELQGETIGCYCVENPKTSVEGKPAVCHGEVILQYLNEVDDE